MPTPEGVIPQDEDGSRIEQSVKESESTQLHWWAWLLFKSQEIYERARQSLDQGVLQPPVKLTRVERKEVHRRAADIIMQAHEKNRNISLAQAKAVARQQVEREKRERMRSSKKTSQATGRTTIKRER